MIFEITMLIIKWLTLTINFGIIPGFLIMVVWVSLLMLQRVVVRFWYVILIALAQLIMGVLLCSYLLEAMVTRFYTEWRTVPNVGGPAGPTMR